MFTPFICLRKTHEDPAALDAAIRGVLVAADVDVVFLVDADYDTGAIVRQCRVPVFRGDSLDDLKARVRAREKEFLVETLGQTAKGEIALPYLLALPALPALPALSNPPARD